MYEKPWVSSSASKKTSQQFDETKEILLAPYRDQDKPVLTPHAGDVKRQKVGRHQLLMEP